MTAIVDDSSMGCYYASMERCDPIVAADNQLVNQFASSSFVVRFRIIHVIISISDSLVLQPRSRLDEG